MQTLTRLMRAAAIGHESAVKEIVDTGEEDLNVRGPMGSTALMFAVGGGHLEIVRILVEKGADINVREFQGWTALRYAQEDYDREMIKYLISNGAIH